MTSRSADALEVLYERFGLENGENLLAPYFPEIQMRRYEDAIEIAEAEPLISYILSCHGNQNQLLLNQYKEFREFVSARVADGFHITKDAGIFLCRRIRAEIFAAFWYWFFRLRSTAVR